MRAELTFEIAGLAARVVSEDAAFMEKAAAELGRPPSGAARAALDISLETAESVTPGKELEVTSIGGGGAVEFGMHGVFCRADFTRGAAELRIYPDASALVYVLKVLFSALLLRNGGGLFHAAGLARDGRGWLFAGPPGAGKSTVAGFSGAGAGCAVLNDEITAVRRLADGRFHVFAMPKWAGGSGNSGNKDFAAGLPPSFPLEACFILSHGGDVSLFHSSIASDRTAWLFDNISYMLPEKGVIDSALRFAEELQRDVRTARLEFALHDGERFWEVIDGYMGKKV